ncbi:MAG: family 2A encapsulin nanocompartment cargo protein cysteine desulfurase [Methylococcaceae bacterium]
MNTSEFDQANLTQQGFTGNLGTASLPDEGYLTQLANELFSALPCDGSRLGLDASAVPGGLSSTLAGFGQSGVTGITPQGFGPPGAVELQQVFAPRKPSFESVPDSLDTGPVYGNSSSAAAPSLPSSFAGVDPSVLAGIIPQDFPHDFGLPGPAELQNLLVTRPPTGSLIPAPRDAGSIPATPSSVAVQEARAQTQATSDNSVETVISPQVFEAELQKLFAANTAATGRIPNSAAAGSIPGLPGAVPTPGLPGSLGDLEASLPTGTSPQGYGLPGEAEAQKVLALRPATGSISPASVEAGSKPDFPSSLTAQDLTGEAPVISEPSVESDISPQVFEAELQKLFAANSAATGNIPKNPLGIVIPSLPASTASHGLTGSLTNLDASLIAGLSPEVYGLPGEAEVLKFFTPFAVPSGSTPESAGTGSSFYFLDELKSGGFNAPGLASAHPPFDVHAVRRDFPILNEKVNGYPLAWLDNAATTQKPQVVIDRVSYFYEHENSNIHRAAHELAARATDAYEKARDTVARFLNAPSSEEIIFVRGTTEGINLVAQSWGRQNLVAGDEIVITWLEHHANIVPWQQLSEVTGAKLRVVPVDDSGQVLLGEFQKLLNSRTKLVSFTHVSNALGTVTPAQEIIAMAHGVGARVLLDAAQSVSHLHVDVQALDCDWCVFSGHKIFGPTGIGAVYGKAELLESMPPWQGGGNMIEDVTFEKTIYQHPPARFEAGTGNIADAVGLGAALDYLTKIGIHNVARYEHELLVYAMEALKSIPGLRLIGTAAEKTSVLSFVLAGHSNDDVGVALNKVGIAVRTGHHCAQPILRRYGLESTVRPSLAFYNTYEEVDRLVSTVKRIQGGNAIY